MEHCSEPVAIIGTGCRFPGDLTPSKFWKLLQEPYDLLKPLGERFDSKAWYHESAKYPGHFNVKHSYQLHGENLHRHFDAPFFGVSAVEANTMDPQMRLLLETVYEALEAAGQSIEGLRGSDTAVYTGMMINGYKAVMERDLLSLGTYHASGSSRATMSHRLSYVFDWHGPSMTIDTACSSSMIAVHQAVMQLRTGQSHVAIAAGANLLLDPTDYIAMSNLEMLSPDGRSKMWDKNANGYARGEGVAAIVLKLLSAAEADGDHIECIIRETATNQDGRTKGITKPSAAAQTRLISDCYARAGLDLLDPAQRPQYFEAHGTGTPAGDPIEAEGIKTAFFPDIRDTAHRRDKLFVGSAKTVIGHSESVAGLAALIKASLALQKSTIPPNLLFQELNPDVRPFYTNLEIPKTAVPWPTVPDGCPRRASVNSFGFGGSNSHAILESYMPRNKSHPNDQSSIIPFVFSAASPASLASNMAAMCNYLRASETDVSARDLALTLYGRRSRHSYGTAVAARSIQDLCRKLEKQCQDFAEARGNPIGIRPSTQLSSGQYRKPRILGVFTGQGSQCPRMGAALIEQSDYCRQIIDRLEARLARLPEIDRPSWSLRQELLEAPAARIGKAAARQRGAMIAVGTALLDAQKLCDEEEFENRVCVAAINSPTSITLSGDSDAVEEMHVIFEDEERLVRRLQVDQAYHSFHMEKYSKEYNRALQELNIESKMAETPWFSSVDEGREISTDDLSRIRSSYWNENMVKPVMFMQAIDQAWKSQGPFDMAIELGPHPALKRLALETIQELHGQKIPYIGVHVRERYAIESFSHALGFIWTNVASVNLSSYDKCVTGHGHSEPITGLPPYSWDHQKEYWHESRYAKSIRTRSGSVHELLGHLTPDSSDEDMRWRNSLCPNDVPWLKNHSIENQAVFPAAGYVVAAVEATAAMAKRRGLAVSLIEVRDLDISKALTFDSDDTKMEIVVTLNNIQKQNGIINAMGLSINLLASGSVIAMLGDSDENSWSRRVGHEEFYRSLSKLGYEYAEQFRALRGLQRKLGFASGSIIVESSAMLIHPAVLDAAFRSLFLANCAPNSGGIWSLHVPKTIRSVRVNPSLCAANTTSNKFVSFDCFQPKDTSGFEGDIDLFATIGDVEQGMVQIQGLCCVPLTRPTAQEDKEMFATTVWDVAAPNGGRVPFDGEPTEEQIHRASLLERMSVFSLRRLVTSPFLGSADVRLLKAFGDNIVDIVTGKTQAIEIGMRDGMLSQVYETGLGFQAYTTFLARIVKQIVHRYPNMRILEVGAGTGGATKKVFSEIGKRFSSYAFTDISSGFFEKAQDLFSSNRDKMLYKILDISRDISSQGYSEYSYDLVIASAVLHATPSLQNTLNNVRRLLKPGGQLVVLELQTVSTAMGTIFGALPGWWLGAQDGRILTPCINLASWDAMLRAKGFSGCDTLIQKYDGAVMPMVVFTSQAVDSRVNFLRAPLSIPMPLFQGDSKMVKEDLIILGGRDPRTSGLIEPLRSLLSSQWGDRISTVPSKSTLLSLLDLEKPIFDACLQQANSLLWVSSNRRSENPHANMMIGLLRLDFESHEQETAQNIADALLTFKAAAIWQRQDQHDDLHLTIEPELVLENDGTLVIPRIVMNQEMNDRGLCLKGLQLCWQKAAVSQRSSGSMVRVTHSLRSALRIPKLGFMHLALGRNLDSNDQLTLPVPVPAAYQLLANLLVSDAPYGATVMVHEAGETGVNIVLTTVSTARLNSGWHHVHPMAPDRQLLDLIPKVSAVFCDLSTDQSSRAAGSCLKACLPNYCSVYDYSSIFADSSICEPLHVQLPYLQNLLGDCISRRLAALDGLSRSIASVPLDAFNKDHGGHPLDIIEWAIPAPGITARVRPADSQVHFSENKTYWLSGLSGSLGLLLCEWMIHRGARYVVISSRAPKVKEQWQAKMRHLGANVRTFMCDITDRAAVLDVYRQIEFSLPQIAGVCQGAMVLEDAALSNMSLDSLLKVTDPKVLGSIHMDELFQSYDRDLEFFIFFSSGGSIIGSVGQGNYAAANLFMTALAERRRRRGQAASVIHIGPIYGVGYLNNHGLDSDFQGTSKRKSMSPISERDFCQHFAEAVIAGRPGPQSSCSEITSGLTRVESPHESGLFLSHVVLDQVHATVETPARLKVSLKSQLVEVQGLEQLAVIIREALLSKLSVLYQMELSTLSHIQSSTMRLDEMGTDSLMALEIRSWFVKELQVNIPVLKILGGMTIDDLVNTAVEAVATQSFSSTLQSTVSDDDDLDLAHSTTTSVISHPPMSSDGSPSPTSTEPTPFPENLLQNPVELLIEKETALLADEEKQSSSSQDIAPTDAVTESIIERPRTVHDFNNTADLNPLKASKQIIRPFPIVDEKILELSFSQSLFYFSAEFTDNPTHLNLTSACRMTGELRIEELKAAVLALGKEHESLRTRFFIKDSRPMQGIMKSSPLHLEHYTIQNESELATYCNDIHNLSTILTEVI
ncbi:hypothetical protein GGR55DRAFT_689814 [Xylaria sp. FL0064]|nr:hypothetical protein GGR55DRAFT_689814 [Xylaria sp. FL0064]